MADVSSQPISVRAQIAHQVPGRIRMKVPSAKGDPEQLDDIKQALSLLPGIEQVEVNAQTGSIVIKYDAEQHDDFHAGFHHHCSQHHGVLHRPPTNEIDALATKIEQEAEFLAEHSHAARVVVDFCRNLDQQIKLSSGNMLDFKMVLAIGLIGITVFEIGANAATPVWVTLTLFGINHFIEMQTAQAEKAAEGVPA